MFIMPYKRWGDPSNHILQRWEFLECLRILYNVQFMVQLEKGVYLVSKYTSKKDDQTSKNYDLVL